MDQQGFNEGPNEDDYYDVVEERPPPPAPDPPPDPTIINTHVIFSQSMAFVLFVLPLMPVFFLLLPMMVNLLPLLAWGDWAMFSTLFLVTAVLVAFSLACGVKATFSR